MTEAVYWLTTQPGWRPIFLLIKLTNQGHYLYGLYYLLTVVAIFRHEVAGVEVAKDSASPWLFWKWCSVLFNMVLTLQFWIFILGSLIWFFVDGTQVNSLFNYVTRHGVYWATLLVDAGLNNIHIEYNHWACLAIYGVFYVTVAVIVVFTLDFVPYPFMTFDTPQSWIVTLGLVVVATTSHLLFYVIAKCRTFSGKNPLYHIDSIISLVATPTLVIID